MVPWGVTEAGGRDGRSAGGGSVADLLSRSSRRSTEGINDYRDVFPDHVTDVWSRVTAELSLPATDATVRRVDGEPAPLSADGRLDAGEYLLKCRLDDAANADAGLETYARFAGPATVTSHDERVTLSFPEPYYVVVGISHRVPASQYALEVPPTPGGLATALTYSAAAHHATGPARSHPALRDHPPKIAVGRSTSVPEEVRTRTPETGVRMLLPKRRDAVFVAAPLAYYLGADVSVEAGATPTLSVPDLGFERQLPRLPDLQHACADTLRKTFFLDCLIRDVDAGTTAASTELQSQLELDPATLRERSPGERLVQYVSVSDALVWPHLPDWHLSTYVRPDADNVACLPYLLDRLSLVYLPQASELQEQNLLERTLDDAYRGPGEVRSVDVLEPELQDGRSHAWLAPGTPIDTFKLTPRAYENQSRYRSNDGGDDLQVTVVLNDDEMIDERTTAAAIYRERASEFSVDLTVTESLTRRELRSVFETQQDFVHYIGHCEESGLRCVDGNLSLSTLSESRTRTFFLNACGSYHEGRKLVENGSVAGAVTLTKVLDSQAAKVGTAFARLLVHGFEIERAIQLARRRILMGKDYAVIGDGTYSLWPVDEPGVVWLEESGDRFELSYEVLTSSNYGEKYSPPFDDTPYLHGNRFEDVLTRSELLSVLRETSLPVIHDGDFKWSAELAAELEDR